MKRNQCAEYLLAALYLDADGDFGPLPDANELFADWRHDNFGSFLEAVMEEGWAGANLRRYLENLYWVDAR